MLAGVLFSIPGMYICVQTDEGTDGTDGEVRLPVMEALLLLYSDLAWCSRNNRTERQNLV